MIVVVIIIIIIAEKERYKKKTNEKFLFFEKIEINDYPDTEIKKKVRN